MQEEITVEDLENLVDALDGSGKKTPEYAAGANAMRVLMSTAMAVLAPSYEGKNGAEALASLARIFAVTEF